MGLDWDLPGLAGLSDPEDIGVYFETLPEEILQAHENNQEIIKKRTENLHSALEFLGQIRKIKKKKKKNDDKKLKLATAAVVMEGGELTKENVNKFLKILRPAMLIGVGIEELFPE